MHASAVRGLSLFLGGNYLTGYALGASATGSMLGGVATALIAPFFTVIAVAMVAMGRPGADGAPQPIGQRTR